MFQFFISARAMRIVDGMGITDAIVIRAQALLLALSEQNSKYLERPSNHSDRPGKMQGNQWPRNPVLTFWQSKRIYSDNAGLRHPPPHDACCSLHSPRLNTNNVTKPLENYQ